MTLRSYLATMLFGTFLAWAAAGVIITMTDPEDGRAVVPAILYAALFLALTGTFAIVGFGARMWLFRQRYFVSRHVLVAFRQALLLSLLLVSALVLHGKDALSWWTAALLLGAVTLLESFFIASKGK